MSIVINLDHETEVLLRTRAALLAEIQRAKSMSGDLHPRSQEFSDLTTLIQMRLGNLAFEQAIASAK